MDLEPEPSIRSLDKANIEEKREEDSKSAL